MDTQSEVSVISHNGQVLARVENGALEIEELICQEALYVFAWVRAKAGGARQ